MKLVFLAAVVVSSLALAQIPVDDPKHLHSAVRLENETVIQAHDRYMERVGNESPLRMGAPHASLMALPVSANDVAVPLSELKFDSLPVWKDMATATAVFEKIRDLKFLRDTDHAGMLRRSTWLYPDDGCYARASLANTHIEQMGSN